MNEDIYEIYEGQEPYLFISYSHQDTDRVIPIVRGLQELGYRLWYDTGIGAGTRWPDVIAEHLMNSNCVIAFISENAMGSDYCQEEIYFAMEEHKPLVAVHLEKTKLSPGLRMRLSARHAMFRYEFTKDKEFLAKLSAEQVLKSSKKTAQPVPVSSEIPKNRQLTPPPKNQSVNHNPVIRNSAPPKSNFAAKAFVDDYINRYHRLPDKLFMDAVDMACFLGNFTERNLHYGLSMGEQIVRVTIQQMLELRLATKLDESTYRININHIDWATYKAEINNRATQKQPGTSKNNWLY